MSRGRHGAIDHVRLDKRFIALDVHDHRIGMQVRCCFRKTVRATLMVETGHDGFASESPDGIRDTFIVGRDEDSLNQPGTLNASVNMFYQCLTLNFDDGLSGETCGLESGRDNRNGALKFHAEYGAEKIRFDYSTLLWTTGVRW